jgi:hypothetical protein
MCPPDGIFGGVVAGTGGVTTDGDVTARAAGHGLRLSTGGAAARQGTSAAMVAGTVVVPTTAITVNSLIFLCHKGNGGNVGSVTETKAGRVAGTSFTILSSNGADIGNVDFIIIEPA